MKTLKKTLCLLLALVLLVCSAPVAFAEPAVFVVGGECGANLTWSLDSTGTLTISGEGKMYGYNWIGDYDENGNYYSHTTAPWWQYAGSIKTVVIGASVTSIGNHAFSSCTALKSVTIGNSVMSIGYEAFSRCIALESVILPDGVISVGNNAFYTDSTNVNGYSYNSHLYTLLFCNKGTTTAATLATTEFPYAFLDGTDEDNLISETVNAKLSYTIDRRTRTLTIQNDGAMVSFASFTAPWVEYQKYVTNVVILPGCTSVSSSAFQNCYNIRRVTLPDGIESIGNSAFSNCYNLTQIELPDGVETIGNRAFCSCSHLPSISLPDSVTSIGYSAFYGCSALESVSFSDNLQSIGREAFAYCASLKTADLGEGLKAIGNEAFSDCTALESIVIPDSVTSLGDDNYNENVFAGCLSLKTAVIGDGVTYITFGTFQNCPALETVTFGENVRTVERYAFARCSSLNSVVLPESVQEIRSSAFPEKALTDLWIYNRNCSIAEDAVYYSATLHGYAGSTTETFADTYGYSFEPITDAPPHDHDKTLVKGTAPTCTDAGLTDGYRCSICGKWITKQKPIKALGHDYQPTETVLPTETENGHVRYECTRCDAGYTEVLPVNTHTHTFTVTDSRDATCLEGGYATYYCPGCGYSYTDIFDALDHSFGAWKTFLPVEAGQAGIDVRFCSRCSVYELRESESTGTGTVTPVDPNHEHSFVQVESKEPDCENAGYVRYLCSCGAGKVEIKNALGHDMQIGECVLETCTTDGYTPWVCTRCGKEIHTDLVPAMGHQWDDGELKKPPTCSTPGIFVTTCKREGCGETIVKELARDPDAHVFKVTVYEPTCVDEGYTSHACTRCRYGYSDNIVPALGHTDANGDGKCDRCGTPTGTGDPCAIGHDLGDWVIRSEPTCTQKGYKSRYCNRCNKPIETEEIAALGHNFKVDQSKSRAATCTEAGFQKEVCTRCGSEKDTTLKVLGHVDANGDGKCDRCKEKLTDADEEEENLNFFQRIIQWFEHLFAKLFGKK